MLPAIIGTIGSLITGATSKIDKLVTSDEERMKAQRELDKLRNELGKAVLEHEKHLISAQRSIIEKELNSGSWIARNWRPLLMVLFGAIVGYNYLILPVSEFIVTTFHINVWIPSKEELPDNIWDLLKIGVGGYIIGRSSEKVAKSLRK